MSRRAVIALICFATSMRTVCWTEEIPGQTEANEARLASTALVRENEKLLREIKGLREERDGMEKLLAEKQLELDQCQSKNDAAFVVVSNPQSTLAPNKSTEEQHQVVYVDCPGKIALIANEVYNKLRTGTVLRANFKTNSSYRLQVSDVREKVAAAVIVNDGVIPFTCPIAGDSVVESK